MKSKTLSTNFNAIMLKPMGILLALALLIGFTPKNAFACFTASPTGSISGPTTTCQLGGIGDTDFFTITASEWTQVEFNAVGGTITCSGTLAGIGAECDNNSIIGFYSGNQINAGPNTVTVAVTWSTLGTRSVHLEIQRNGRGKTKFFNTSNNFPVGTVTITGPSGLICTNTSSVSLQATGGSSYQWSHTSSSGVPLSHNTTGSFVTFTNFTPGTMYSINVTGTNSCGGGVTGSTTLITGLSCRPNANDPLAAKDNILSNDGIADAVKVFPNPVRQQDFINLTIPSDLNDADIHLIDSKGQLISTTPAQEGQTQLNVAALPNGIYHLKIVNAKHSVSKSIVIGASNQNLGRD